MIKSFRDPEAELIFNGQKSRKLPADIQKTTHRKLHYLDAAKSIRDIASLPSNRLDKLSKEREGQYSIRINDKWRICFEWKDNDAHEVDITDYHDDNSSRK